MEGKLPLSLLLMLYDPTLSQWLDRHLVSLEHNLRSRMDVVTLGTTSNAQGDVSQVISFKAVSTLVNLCCLGLELSMSCRLKAFDTTDI